MKINEKQKHILAHSLFGLEKIYGDVSPTLINYKFLLTHIQSSTTATSFMSFVFPLVYGGSPVSKTFW